MKNLSKTITILCIALLCQIGFSQCDAPLNLTVTYSNITNQSTFSWGTVSTATEYRFQVRFPWDTWTSIDAPLQEVGTAISYSYTGLATSFPFEWRVSSICGTTESAFSPIQYYSVPCPLPNGLSTTNITTTSALLNWNSFPAYTSNTAAFSIAYRVLNSGSPWIQLGNSTTFNKPVAGLQPNTTYEWCVNTTCTFFNSAPVIGIFTTASSSCNLLPMNLRSTSTTHEQNRAVWDAVSGASSYTVQYKKNSDTNWTTANASSNYLIMTGLSQETLYDWRVRANCNVGSGNYSSNSQFHTYSAFCRSYGVNTWEWIDLFSLGTINRTSGQDAQGYFNSAQSTNLVIGSSGNAGQFSVGYSTNTTYQNRYVIYIDFNRNGNFADPGELVLSPQTTNNGGIYNFSFSIPSNVTPGATKLKVVMRRGGGATAPCAQGVRGEVEDYVVNLVASSNMTLGSNEEDQALDELEVSNRSKINDDISITPNPSIGIFDVQASAGLQVLNYKIYNAVNSLILENNMSASGMKIDLSQHPSGIYHLIINTVGGERKVIRLLKL